MLQQACRESGVPLPAPPPFNVSLHHHAAYEVIREDVERQLNRVHTPNQANLVHVANGIYQLDLY